MKPISFSPAAEADMEGIRDYTADRWGIDQADSYRYKAASIPIQSAARKWYRLRSMKAVAPQMKYSRPAGLRHGIA